MTKSVLPPRVAIIGTGVSGLVTAALLAEDHDLTLFESSNWIGGHAHTVDLELSGQPWEVDTGFMVFNERTYPNFCRLLDLLGIASQPSDMSFSVHCAQTGLEYNGSNLNTLFAQRRNLFRPRFYRLLTDIMRFHREAPRLLDRPGDDPSVGEFLRREGYGTLFREQYLVPMGSAIWSSSTSDLERFPARFFIRFFLNHGLLSIRDRPTWRTIPGGSRRYVEALVRPFRERIRLNTPVRQLRRAADRVELQTTSGTWERFDYAIVATHSDQALRLLADPTVEERSILSALPYQANDVALHTDPRMLPQRRRAWASWNYHRTGHAERPATVTYHLNRLQGLAAPRPISVTLNRGAEIDPTSIRGQWTYEHPRFTSESLAAQGRWAEINGPRRTYFCGAYWRNGFHEDGVVSALNVARLFGKSFETCSVAFTKGACGIGDSSRSATTSATHCS